MGVIKDTFTEVAEAEKTDWTPFPLKRVAQNVKDETNNFFAPVKKSFELLDSLKAPHRTYYFRNDKGDIKASVSFTMSNKDQIPHPLTLSYYPGRRPSTEQWASRDRFIARFVEIAAHNASFLSTKRRDEAMSSLKQKVAEIERLLTPPQEPVDEIANAGPAPVMKNS